LYYYLSNQFDNEIVARVMADFIYQDIYDIEQYNHDKIFHPLISYPNLNVVHIPKIILIFYKDVINPKYKYLLDKGSSQSISSKELPFIILTYKERDRFIFKSLNEKYQFKILGETSIYALKLVGLDESKSTFDLYKNSNKIGTISVGHRLPPDLEKGTITKFSLDNNLNLIVRSWVSNIQGKVPEDVDISLLLEGK
jgi:hypothetical protein